MEASPTRDEQRIQADLAAVLGEEVQDIRPIPEGHSGFTYWVELPSVTQIYRDHRDTPGLTVDQVKAELEESFRTRMW